KMVWCGVGAYMVLYFCPQYILPSVFIGGLIVSVYGILDVINKSDLKGEMDLQSYLDNMNKK
ncbi:MAG: hypothetical protein ACRCTZ_17430, partial [Sarcina sp.]